MLICCLPSPTHSGGCWVKAGDCQHSPVWVPPAFRATPRSLEQGLSPLPLPISSKMVADPVLPDPSSYPGTGPNPAWGCFPTSLRVGRASRAP